MCKGELSSLCLSIFFIDQVFFLSNKNFITYFSGPMRSTVFKFCIHLQKLKVYCVKEILYLSIFILSNKIFVTYFSGVMKTSVLKYCIHLQGFEVYCVKQNQDTVKFFCRLFPCFFFFFFFFFLFFFFFFFLFFFFFFFFFFFLCVIQMQISDICKLVSVFSGTKRPRNS